MKTARRPERTEGPPTQDVPAERHVREPVTAATPSTEEREKGRFVEMMNAISMILSARAILAGAIFGAFVIGCLVTVWPSWQRLAALGIYSLTAIGSAALLELRRTR